VRRLALLALAAAVGCAFAAQGAGSASQPPAVFAVANLSNAPGSTGPVLTLLVPIGSDTLLATSASIYVPSGYGVDLARPVGTKVGIAVAAPSFEGADLIVADPAAHANDVCAPGTHAAVWTALLTIGGVPTTVPIFVDPTAGDETARGAYRLTFCQTAVALLELEALTAPAAPGFYTWRAFVSPLGALGNPPDPNAVYELRSVVALPHSLRIKTKYDAKSQRLTITGTATAAGRPEANSDVDIELLKAKRPVSFATATTNANGTFTVRKRVVETRAARTLEFDAISGIATADCTDPPLAPAGCLLQTSAPSSDALFKVRIPKLPPKTKH
jgi:hypothetical protein